MLDEKNCTLKNGQWVPCTTLEFCIDYDGIGVPSEIGIFIQICFLSFHWKFTCYTE